MMDTDPRRSIARLAAAVMAADSRVTSSEISAVGQLVRLGLGSLEAITRDELARAAHEGIDVDAACAVLGAAYPDAGGTILAALADIAASDGELDPREIALLGRIGDALGVEPSIVAHVVRTAAAAAGAFLPDEEARPEATAPPAAEPAAASRGAAPVAAPGGAPGAAPPAEPLAAAYAMLGLAPGATATAVDHAYRAVLERYQPLKVLDLGPEFAVLAVRRLAAATAAYTAIAEAGEEGA